MTGSVWDTLGIARTRDQKEIKRAYARRLKETNPEDDPEGFKTLRTAYERALAGVDDSGDSVFVFPSLKKPEKVEATPVEAAQDAAEPSPPDPRQIHAGLQGRLENLLRKRQVDPDAVLAAFTAVLKSPAMDLVDVHAATEEWLAWLIANRSPRTDILIAPGCDRFGWGGRGLRQRDHFHVQRILARQRDLNFLGEIRKADSEHNAAYRILSAPPKPVTVLSRLLGQAPTHKISDLLDVVRREYPTAIADLNSETVAQWDDYQARPQLGTWGLRFAAASPPCLVGLLLGQWLLPPEWSALSILLIIPPAFAVASLIGVYGFEMPRRMWLSAFVYGAPVWLRYGWALAIVAALAAAAALPASPITALAVAAASLVVAMWARTTGQADTSDGQLPWQLRAAFSEIYLLAWWLVLAFNLVPLMPFLQMSAAMVAAAVVSAYGQRPMFELWLSWPKWGRLLYGLMVLGLATGTAVLLNDVARAGADAWWPGVAAAVAVTVLAHRPLIPLLGEWGFRLKWYSMIGLVWFALHGGAAHVVIAGAAVLLFWAVAHTILVTARDTFSRT
ncbi:dnaJ domain protein [Asticcacaulis biprosthecium C19]|uniref:DnaJ domain protein n=1 Tax=Asticcacaulis biprosthecium C19 TaxID=715226 RepID=F4QSS6_9CAUL|nr:dnaJ domain protein [Asticcacaulis biprosthecium C19]